MATPTETPAAPAAVAAYHPRLSERVCDLPAHLRAGTVRELLATVLDLANTEHALDTDCTNLSLAYCNLPQHNTKPRVSVRYEDYFTDSPRCFLCLERQCVDCCKGAAQEVVPGQPHNRRTPIKRAPNQPTAEQRKGCTYVVVKANAWKRAGLDAKTACVCKVCVDAGKLQYYEDGSANSLATLGWLDDWPYDRTPKVPVRDLDADVAIGRKEEAENEALFGPKAKRPCPNPEDIPTEPED